MTELCGICKGDPDRRAFVNAELVKGTPHTRIEAISKTIGLNVKRETIRRHVNVCVPAALHEEPPTRGEKMVLRVRDLREKRALTNRPTPAVPLKVHTSTDDFAQLVRDAAKEKLLNGELRITTQDGLQAQNLIDRREEKKKDRELMAQMGLLLSRGSAEPPMIDVSPTPEEEEQLLLEA